AVVPRLQAVVVRNGRVLAGAKEPLRQNTPVADTFINTRGGWIVHTGLHRDTRRNQIRKPREGAEGGAKGSTQPVNQRTNKRVAVDALEKPAAVVAYIAHLSHVVPINLALNAE